MQSSTRNFDVDCCCFMLHVWEGLIEYGKFMHFLIGLKLTLIYFCAVASIFHFNLKGFFEVRAESCSFKTDVLCFKKYSVYYKCNYKVAGTGNGTFPSKWNCADLLFSVHWIVSGRCNSRGKSAFRIAGAAIAFKDLLSLFQKLQFIY